MSENKGIKILALSLAISGLLSTTSGLILNKLDSKNNNTKIEIKVIEKKIAKIKSNIPILNDINVEINQPISIDIKSYISNIEDISDQALREFKLDTSLVNVTQAGKYTYTINYKNKKYIGNVIVKDRPLPTLNLKLKNLAIKLNSTLPVDVKSYIDSTIPEEAIQTIKLDISKVNTNVAGDYQYTITYNNQLYTGKINIYEEQPTQTLNTINYTLKYVCGTKVEKIKRSQTSNTKTLTLNQVEIIKPESFTECSNIIDTDKTTIKFPISVSNNNSFTIYFKQSDNNLNKQNTPLQ